VAYVEDTGDWSYDPDGHCQPERHEAAVERLDTYVR